MFDEIDNTEGEDMLMDLAPVGAVHVGRIVGYERHGHVSVEFNGCEPKEARLIAGLSQEELAKAVNNKREVLIVFEQGNPDRPIVLGLMESTEADVSNEEPEAKQPLAEAVVDGEYIAGIVLPYDILEDIISGQKPEIVVYFAADVPDEIRNAVGVIIRELAYQQTGQELNIEVSEEVLGPDMLGMQIPPRDRMRPILAVALLIFEITMFIK